ncbi:MAG: response regulator transcription factor [Chitinophagaceae bacterium]
MFTKAETTFQSDVTDKSIAIITNPSKQKGKADYREKWLKKMEFLNSISAQTNAVILLHDTSVNRFLYMSDKPKILGNYNPADFTSETGMDFFFSNIHAEQRSAALLIQLQIMSYGMDNSSACLNNCVANMRFLYKRKSGGHFQFLQKAMVVETDPSGYPLLYLYYGFDISHLVRPSVGLIINTPDETLIWAYNIHKKSLDRVNLLSRQEKKILGLLAQGKHSKEIGDMLFISSHTIDTHRRNLLKKTNCIDSTALISFAKMTGLI